MGGLSLSEQKQGRSRNEVSRAEEGEGMEERREMKMRSDVK